MAPEQFRATRHVDQRADVYAAGVILYEMLSRRRPFDAETYEELIIQVTTEPCTPLRSANPLISPELEQVVHRAMEREVGHRFDSMAELARSLRSFASLADDRRNSGFPVTVQRSEPVVPAAALPQPTSPTLARPLPETRVAVETKAPFRAAPVRSGKSLYLAGAVIAVLVLVAASVGITLAVTGNGDQDDDPIANVLPIPDLPPQPVASGPGPSPVPVKREVASEREEREESKNSPEVAGQTGFLTVNSRPWTKVYVDGRFVNNSPLIRHKLAVGIHAVKLANPDFNISEKFSVHIKAGENKQVIKNFSTGSGSSATTTTKSTGQTGFLSVNTRPWTKVYVDGRFIMNTPLMRYRLSAGAHRLTLINEDLNIRETLSVQIKAGENKQIVRNLSP